MYEPAFFERVGLRYVNAVSRKALGLTDLLWDDLIRSPYLGILGEPDVDESKVGKSAMDTELTLEGDFSLPGSTAADKVPQLLGDLHQYAVRFFHGAITPELHEAMGPLPVLE